MAELARETLVLPCSPMGRSEPTKAENKPNTTNKADPGPTQTTAERQRFRETFEKKAHIGPFREDLTPMPQT